MYKLKIKKAFTMIELIFVIVVFAIISMFGADLYTKIYDSYIQTRAMNQLESRTGSVLSLISSRLEDRIRGTVIGRIQTTGSYIPISWVGETHDVLEWLGQSVESRNLVMPKPEDGGTAADSIGWSGFADFDSVESGAGFVAPTADTGASFSFTTQGSNLNSALAVINNIKGSQNFAIIFRNVRADSGFRTSYGFDGVNADKIAIANVVNDNTISVNNYQVGATQIEYSEQYYLTHSAYAIVPTPINGTPHPQGGKVFDLELRYNYEPWNGQTYNNNNTPRAVIARDVSLFRFKDDNGAVAMKLCMRDNGRNLDPNRVDLIVCKSQVVY